MGILRPLRPLTMIGALILSGAALPGHASFASEEPLPHPSPSPVSAQADLLNPPMSATTPNYHLVGWFNTVVPGGGEALLGNWGTGGMQLGLEAATFGYGYSLSKLHPLTIDGVPEDLPSFRIRRPSSQADLSRALYADILQEFGLKYHMVNVFDAYREAAKRSGVTERIDQTPTNELFLKPFALDSLSNPWVYIPVGIIAAYTAVDYYSARANIQRNQRLTPYSNFLYATNYGIVQPIGSGVPEELFFRGFLQNEIYDLIPSPYIAIPATAALFALAHAPGDGRYTAGLSGLYLGYLAHKYQGNLVPGITLHFWGVVLLGLETILLNNEAQHTTPPASFYVQINY